MIKRVVLSLCTLPRLVAAVLVAVALVVGAQSERLGDRYQVALPLLGLGCAAATGGAPEYVLRYAVLWTGIRAGKNGLGHRALNMRPGGGDGGMPSGHTSSAAFGASSLVHGCLARSPAAQTAAIVAAGFTGASRIEAGAHTIWQVLAGVLWALLCDRALRAAGPARAAVIRGLNRVGRGSRRLAVRLRGWVQGAIRQQPDSIRMDWPAPSNTRTADSP